MSKKFVNQLDETVDDSLFGLVSSNSNVKFHETCPRVILQSTRDPSKVALIAGGGCGHEPYAAGYVGRGLLTAAVAGNVFASPPSRNVQAALEGTRSNAGAILFVINYTGDRLNFGLAAERFNASGGTARVITIADDVAIDNPNSRVGRRGLAGAVLTIKIAGAMAEAGASLEEISEMSDEVISSMGTLGVSLYPGSLPGKEKEKGLPEDQIEVGLGIHGEPGKRRAAFASAKEIISGLMDTLAGKLGLISGQKETDLDLVVLVNNLGSVSQLEMGIVNGEVLRWMKSHSLHVSRFFSGTYMTSLDGHGVSVTILKATDKMIRLLDQPADANSFHQSYQIAQEEVVPRPRNQELRDSRISEIPNSGMSTSTSNHPQLIRAILEAFISAMKSSESELNRLDAVAGDGDCGETFASAARAISESFTHLSLSHPQTLLRQLSQIFEQTVGGTSGALYALMFSSAAGCFSAGSSGKICLKTCLEALEKANEAVQKYGGARVGDRTMVDSLDAAVESLKGSISESSVNWEQKCENCVKAAEHAALQTAHQTAAVGRASYTSSESQKQPDAGATAIAIWLRSVWTVIRKEI